MFLRYYQAAIKQGRKFLLENDAREVCKAYGISVPDGALARGKAEALKIASKLQYPIALKVVSPQVLHKSDVGGVKVNLSSDTDLERSYDEIAQSVTEKVRGAEIIGMLVTKMASNGVETIVGTKKDATFGQVVMFGVGGILAELYKDVVIRVCPISEQEAEEMLNEIKGKVILNGFRGMPSVNRAALQTTLLATCSLAEENPEIDSIDLNPVLADEKGAVALDSRIIVA